MDGDAPDVVFEHLDLARVQPRADLNAERSDALADGDRRADSAIGPVEGGEHAIAGAVHLPSAMSIELPSDDDVVGMEELPPPAVPHPGGFLSGPNDVGEQDRGQDPVRLWGGADPGDELLNLAHHRVLVSGPDKVVRARQLDVLRVGDMRCKVAAVGDPFTAAST